jgi:hypothetical protein
MQIVISDLIAAYDFIKYLGLNVPSMRQGFVNMLSGADAGFPAASIQTIQIVRAVNDNKVEVSL